MLTVVILFGLFVFFLSCIFNFFINQTKNKSLKQLYLDINITRKMKIIASEYVYIRRTMNDEFEYQQTVPYADNILLYDGILTTILEDDTSGYAKTSEKSTECLDELKTSIDDWIDAMDALKNIAPIELEQTCNNVKDILLPLSSKITALSNIVSSRLENFRKTHNSIKQSQSLRSESTDGTLAKVKSKSNKLVACPKCKQKYDVSEIINVPDFDEDEKIPGQQVKCRNCTFIFTLPEASAFMMKSKKKTPTLVV